MHRFLAAYAYAFAFVVLTLTPGFAQNVATGTATIPAAGRPEGPDRAADPKPAETLNYDTAHLEQRLSAIRASGDITLDGSLDEGAWREAPIANGFIQYDPREGTPAT